jgi:TRAP-type C4-dicarboxylate transport system permease small subunit
MAEWLERVSLWCGRLTGLVVVVMAAALVGSLLISIFFRYVVGSALSWPEEISLMLFAWIVLLTGSLGVREGFHARLTIVRDHLPPSLHKGLETATTCLVGAFGGFLIYSGYDLVERTAQHLTPTLRLPLDLVNYSAPVCGALIVVHSLRCLWGPAGEDKLHE